MVLLNPLATGDAMTHEERAMELAAQLHAVERAPIPSTGQPNGWEEEWVCLIIATLEQAVWEADQAAQPVWTTDKPTVAGWYWWRQGGCDRVRYVHAVRDNLLRVEAPDGWFEDMHFVDGEWAGPLPLPKEATCQK